MDACSWPMRLWHMYSLHQEALPEWVAMPGQASKPTASQAANCVYNVAK